MDTGLLMVDDIVLLGWKQSAGKSERTTCAAVAATPSSRHNARTRPPAHPTTQNLVRKSTHRGRQTPR